MKPLLEGERLTEVALLKEGGYTPGIWHPCRNNAVCLVLHARRRREDVYLR